MDGGIRCGDFFKSLGIGNVPTPRAPPRFIRPPSPLTLERPQPIVSDVSLIADSASTSMYSNADLFRGEHNQYDANATNRSTANDSNLANNMYSNSGGDINRLYHHNNQTENFIPTPLVAETKHSSPDRRRDANSAEIGSSFPKYSNEISDAIFVLDGSCSRRSTREESTISEGLEVLQSDVTKLLKVVAEQRKSITTMEAQVQQILQFQEKFLMHLVRNETGLAKVAHRGRNGDARRNDVLLKSPMSSPQMLRKSAGDAQHSSSSTSVQNQNMQKSKGNQYDTDLIPIQNQVLDLDNASSNSRNQRMPPTQPLLASDREKHITEDVSTVLKNLQINNVQMPSLYSETSVNLAYVPQFHDETNNSPFFREQHNKGTNDEESESDDDEEPSVPTATFYTKMLSTVNRILDGESGTNSDSDNERQNKEEYGFSTNTATHHSSRISPMMVTGTGNTLSKPQSSNSSSTVSYRSDVSVGSSNDGRIIQQGFGSNNRINMNNNETSNENKQNQHTATAYHHVAAAPPCLSQKTSLPSNGLPSDNVVDVTKNYLATLGVKFDSPNPSCNGGSTPSYPHASSSSQQQRQNYMIQQNVYNSIYIPTVNCVPIMTDSLNSNSGMIENLAHKYLPSSELKQYDMLQSKTTSVPAVTETTTYGMMPSNLSFATKQYLQRYGLVGQSPSFQNNQEPHIEMHATPNPHQQQQHFPMPQDRILDITAIRNQPKLL